MYCTLLALPPSTNLVGPLLLAWMLVRLLVPYLHMETLVLSRVDQVTIISCIVSLKNFNLKLN